MVFDPLEYLQSPQQMDGALLRVWAISAEGYHELTTPPGLRQPGEFVWLQGVGLGLTLWQGQFEEDLDQLWLRWCDRQGQVIPTGAERAKQAEAQARQAEAQAKQAEAQAQRLAERLRAMGIDPDQI